MVGEMVGEEMGREAGRRYMACPGGLEWTSVIDPKLQTPKAGMELEA